MQAPVKGGGGAVTRRKEKRREGEGRGGRREHREAALPSLFLKQKVESVARLAGSWPVVHTMPGLQYCGKEFSRLRVAAWHCPIDLNTHAPEAAEKASTDSNRQTTLKVSQRQARKCEMSGRLGRLALY